MPLDFKNPCSESHLRTLRRNYDEYVNRGDKETAALFKEQIEETERKCGVVTRSMSSTSQLKRNQQRGMPSGFAQQMDVLFPSSREETEIPHVPTTAFGRQLEASRFGGSQDTVQRAVTSSERTQHGMAAGEERAFIENGLKRMESRILNRISKMELKKLNHPEKQRMAIHRGFGQGFRGMLDAIGEQRMLDENPLESKIFDWMRKPTKEETGGRKFTMIGLETFELIKNADGSRSLKSVDQTPPEQPRPPDEIPQCLVELEYHRRGAEEERIQRAIAARDNPVIDTRYGLKAMLTEAFR